jgi:hexosaminidase
MKNPTFYCIIITYVLSGVSCSENEPLQKADNSYAIIPQPARLGVKPGQFEISGDTKILLATNDEGMKTAAAHLASLLIKATGATFAPAEGSEKKDAIHFQLDPTITHEEGYRLSVSPYEISIKAKTGAGAFYAVQTLRQLLHLEAETGKAEVLYVPCVEIDDAPRYLYRGLHLDVGRHFFPIDFIKKYIDLLALHKFNRFHWHLTEDQGWRLEIKKYPRLQEVAACRNETLVGHYNDQPQRFDGQKYCGYYTQEEAREIVRYAAERFITVIPEIEMPGHAQAAVAAYPELGCTGKPVQVATKWGIFDDVYCPNEATFKFLEEVLTEVLDIFPSTYIHIGGDECPKTQWKASPFCQNLIKQNNLKDEHGLQSYFIRRIEQFLNSKGRQIIGWDEILEGGLAPNATVMSWRGTEGGIAAARQRHNVIMTPTDFCYLDYYQSQDPGEPLAIGGYLPLEKVYGYEPTPSELTPEEARHILGAQGNVWTEYMKDGAKVEYMAYPRACALAEVTWSPKEVRNYDNFVGRLSHHLARLKAMGVNAANKIYDVKTSVSAGDGKSVFVSLSPKMEGVDLRYTLDGSEPAATSPVFEKPISIDKSCTLKATSFKDGNPAGNGAELVFEFNKATGKAIQLTHLPAEKYSGNGPGSLVNGVKGSNERYGGPEWLGFEGKDCEAVIDLGGETEIQRVMLRFFEAKGQWIYPPKSIMVSVSSDGKKFKEVIKPIPSTAGVATTQMISEKRFVFDPVKATHVKIYVERFGIIPEKEQGAGHEAWLFVDEILVD